MAYRYTHQRFVEDKMARALGRDLPISPKKSVEICSHLKKKSVENAKQILQDAIEMKKPIPFKRFNKGLGHKAGMAAGRYAVRTCEHILKLLKSAESNANQKGLGSLVIVHMCANKGANTHHYGRKGGRLMKRTNVEIVVEEKSEKKKESKVIEEKPGEKKQ